MLHTSFDTSTKFTDSNDCSKFFHHYDKVSYLFFSFSPNYCFLISYFFFQSPLSKLSSKDSFVCPVDYSLSIMNDEDDVSVQILASNSLSDHEFILT